MDIIEDGHLTLEQVTRGQRVTRWQRVRYVAQDRRVTMAQDDLELGRISLAQFLRRSSYAIGALEENLRNWANAHPQAVEPGVCTSICILIVFYFSYHIFKGYLTGYEPTEQISHTTMALLQ